jgi:hypothetical protein
MDPTVSAIFFAVGLILGMLLLFERGRQLRTKELRTHHENESGLGVVEIFAKFGLLVRIHFFRRDGKIWRASVVDCRESEHYRNCLQPVLRGLFRSYFDARLGVYRELRDVRASNVEQARTKTLQGQIWSETVAASVLPGVRPDAARFRKESR